PDREDQGPPRPARGGGHDPWRDGPRGPEEGGGRVSQQPRGRDPDRDRCRGGGDQPPARTPDGELRPPLESEPVGTALRPYPPDRADGGLSPLESSRGRDAGGGRLPSSIRKARGGEGGAERSG